MRQKIFNYIKTKYNTSEEYPWEKYPAYAVLRHDDNKKWYGIIMNVTGEKIGLDDKNSVDVIDVKCDPSLIDILLKTPGFLPAYHMNKEHWISIRLDGTVAEQKIYDLIDKSYQLTL